MSPRRIPWLFLCTLTLLVLDAPTANAGSKNARAAAVDETAIPGESEVVTEAVTDELLAKKEEEKEKVDEKEDDKVDEKEEDEKVASTSSKTLGSTLLDNLHVPHLLKTSGSTLPSTEVKHQVWGWGRWSCVVAHIR